MSHLLEKLIFLAVIFGVITTGLYICFPAFVIPIAGTASAVYFLSAVAATIHAKKVDRKMNSLTKKSQNQHLKKSELSLEKASINSYDKNNINIKKQKEDNIINKNEQKKYSQESSKNIENDNTLTM